MASSTFQFTGYDDPEMVRNESEVLQRQYGNCLPCKLPIMERLCLKQNNLTNLKEIWDSWESSRKAEFDKKYGYIGYLIGVEPEKEMIEAMIQYWDPSHRCFTFYEADMTPTIEEYTVLLGLKLQDPNQVYQPRTGFKIKLAEMLDVPVHYFTPFIQEVGRSEYIRKDFLLCYIRQHPVDDKGLRAMALAIYGLIIFPRAIGCISAAVVKLIEQVDHGCNPIPAILAETILSLNTCRRNGGGRLKGCVQLLHIWMKSHFLNKGSYFLPAYGEDKAPFQEFQDAVWPKDHSKEGWLDFFQNLTRTNIVWRAPWMPQSPMLYRCGEYPWVALLGLWGAVSYAPTLVRRQLGSEQFIPVTHGLDHLEFDYKEAGSDKLKKAIVEAWRSARRMESGRLTDDVTIGYTTWHAHRGRGQQMLEVQSPNLSVQIEDNAQDVHTEIKTGCKFTTQQLQDDNLALLEEIKRLKEERDNWKAIAERTSNQVNPITIYYGEADTGSEQVEKNSQLRKTIQLLKDQVQEGEKAMKTLQSNWDTLAKAYDQVVQQNLLYQLDKDNLVVERDRAVSQSRSFQSLVNDLIAKGDQMSQENNRLQESFNDSDLRVKAQEEIIHGITAKFERLMGVCERLKTTGDSHELFKERTKHLVTECKSVTKKAREMAEALNKFRRAMVPRSAEELSSFLDHLYKQLEYVGRFH